MAGADHSLVEERIARIEAIVGRDLGRRGIERLVRLSRGGLLGAARSLAEHPRPHVAIVSGFYIPRADPPAAESDGPVGAAHMAAAFRRAGIPCRFATDTPCLPVMRAAAAAAGLLPEGFPIDAVALREGDGGVPLDEVRAVWTGLTPPLSHVIAFERCGPAADGRCYNMRGDDVTPYTAPLDRLFLGGEWVRIGMGDGGNEIGMGSIPPEVIAADVRNGERIHCRTPCDHLIVLGVTNWGGFALPAALALLRPDLRPALTEGLTPEADALILRRITEDGPAVDGVAGRPAFQVDGVPWEVHGGIMREVLAQLA
jgi:D-glutamate cyclase